MRSVELAAHLERSMEDQSGGECASLAQKIFTNLNCVFERDDSLDEFDIIPVESQSNKSPVIYIDHKLALESWCVPFLYSHSFRQFLATTNPSKSSYSPSPSFKGHRKCSNCSSSPSFPRNGGHAPLLEEDRITTALQLSRILILLNPDLSLAWNYRRSIFNSQNLKERLPSFSPELNLISLVLSRKPKCSEGFAYRKWLVKTHLDDLISNNSPLDGNRALQFFQQEAIEVEKAATRYFSNYHAWNYRLWLLDTFTTSLEEKKGLLLGEKGRIDRWIESHISDYSGFHYRQRLLLLLIREKCCSNELNLLEEELASNQSLILLYPGHEGLWYHRRFILSLLLNPTNFENDLRERIKGGEFILVNQICPYPRHLASNGSSTSRPANHSEFKSLVNSVRAQEGFHIDSLADYTQINILYAQRHGQFLSKYHKMNIFQ